ncbi:MarR family winged helix-turn-helix transcriptional regulator [Streptomyces zagrosensis]|uniref:DNA-binding MarR family transcriptional regulator n=1 Tax=Streptomyces zagrosensis TaxID=1042984 RepID=A0A7W9Q6X0_9ACTN|nr:MarR family transcriptional regulator [Streptomyces zagrosensis]MBB5934736.1 DNA-binding MarR family transcriptional regulator [Streptomyces zagrosensis]
MDTPHGAAPAADSIDRHIAHWGHEVPDLDPTIEGAVTRMQMLVRHLQRRKEAGLAQRNVKMWEYEILWRLRSAGEPYRMTPTRLAEGLGVHPATLTNRLDRLAKSGYVTREYAPQDRRSLLVTLTEQGHAAWSATIGEQQATERALLAPLSEAEREHLVVLLRKIAVAAESDGPPLMPFID